MIDYKQKVKDKKEEQSELESRWIADEELLYLDKYIMKDVAGNPVPDIVNVTLNRPAVFAANIISALGSTVEQVVVESEDKNIDTAYIEDFQKRAFASANSGLRVQGRTLLNPFFDTQLCIRGRAAARCLFQMINGELVTDIAPWDARYVTYEMGTNGLEWAAYETTRTKAMLEVEYPDITVTGKSIKVLDVWDTEHNEVWVADKKIFEQEHPFGFCPVVIQIVPLGYGSILLGTNRIKHEGESIFFLIRDVTSELNRLISIMQTLNLKAVKPPMKQKKLGGGKPAKYEDVTGMGAVTAMEPTEDIVPIDYGDAQRSAQMAYGMMDKAMQEGSLSSIDLGTLQFQLSAVALIEIGEGRDQVFIPRLSAKASINQQLAEMFTKQVGLIGGSIGLGVSGHKRNFDVSKLEGEYETTYRYLVKDAKVDAARFSMAASAGYLIPDKAKRRDILQREDPDEDERQLRWEEAEKLSPAIKMRRTIETLIEMEEDEEAQLMSDEMGINLEQMLSGNLQQQPKPEEPQKPQPMMPMFGGGSSAKKASMLQQTPRATVEEE